MLIMRPRWTVNVRSTATETVMRVMQERDDVLKARLPAWPEHPRALLTLCEGLALWHGWPLRVAVSADADSQDNFERIFYADGLIEPQSPLVVLEHHLDAARRGRRIRGVGGERRRLRIVRDER
jgi:hypothetical protein